MILQYPQKDTSRCCCTETPTQILASTNFFLSKWHIRDYQQAFEINKTKRKVKCKRENLVVIFIFQNVENLIQSQISPLQTAEF